MFIHLRTHSDYSLLEGAIKVNKLVDLCVQNNMPALALTDNNNLFGALEFCEYAVNKGIQPIVGCNLYIQYNDECAPLLFLASNEQGLHNLIVLVSQAFKQRKNKAVTWQELRERNQGLIVLSGGVNSLLDKQKHNLQFITQLCRLFPEHLYIELQRHDLPTEKELENHLLEIAHEYALPLVATNDVFFADRQMYTAHDALLCIAEGRYVSETKRKKLTAEHYFKTTQEMHTLFSDLPCALTNTMVIAQRCTVMAEVKTPILPRFIVNEEEAITKQAYTGLQERLEEHVFCKDMHKREREELYKKYSQRLQDELQIINKMHYAGYFLIVSDFIKWSKANNVPVGPGRGSGAGSLVAWSLKITDLDPLSLGLIFERFLNPERVTLPDFDIDFCPEKRDLVLEYVRQKYHHVAQIITFGKLQARVVLRDVGRVLQLPYSQVDAICKMIPSSPSKPITLVEAIELDKNLQHERDNDKDIEKLLSLSLQLEGLYRHASIHAAGIVISAQELTDLVPLYYTSESDMPITQYSMQYVEKAGLIKFDFLGLTALTIIAKTCELITDKIDIDKISLKDIKTYELLKRGDAGGVFQLEGLGMRAALNDLQPDKFEDIIALISLYRPGPMDNIATYAARKHGRKKPDYLHPMLKHVLKETFGIIIYQEQVIEIARVMANYTTGQADLLRRAMGKKIKQEMGKQKERFISGAMNNKVTREKASYIFDLVAKFAGYGFNKSHAAAYALLSYRTAYLKANYTLEFIVASMNLEIHNTEKLLLFYQEARDHDIAILPPDINKSQAYFTIEHGEIRYALGALKNVGTTATKQLAQCSYTDIWDFIKHADSKLLNKKIFESLIASGAFIRIHDNCRQIYDNVEILIKYANLVRQEACQHALFTEDTVTRPLLADCPEWSQQEKIAHEFIAIGFYLTDHPLNIYIPLLKKMLIKYAVKEKDFYSASKFYIASVITSIKIKPGKRGSRFARIVFSNPKDIFVADCYDKEIIERNILTEGLLVVAQVSAKKAQEGRTSLIVHTVYVLEEFVEENIALVVIRLPNDDLLEKLVDILKSGGKTKIILEITIPSVKKIITFTLTKLYHFNINTFNTLNSLPLEVVIQRINHLTSL